MYRGVRIPLPHVSKHPSAYFSLSEKVDIIAHELRALIEVELLNQL